MGLIYHHWTGPIFYLQAVLSVINHYGKQFAYREKQWVNLIDKMVAHGIVVATVYEAVQLPFSMALGIYWVCLSWVTYVYKISHLSNHPKYGDYWHGTLHFMASFGTCALLYAYIQHKEKSA